MTATALGTTTATPTTVTGETEAPAAATTTQDAAATTHLDPHQHTAGPMAGALTKEAPAMTNARATSTTPPVTTCKEATPTAATGCEIWGP